ncbi:hypothetical protein HU200_048570 [Digitaria exilis]|uniref:Uncharacterized protein n=1 Tax=Digitaria exilis TaxID=1010633 RepID=A0A835AST9_9POAL|nr:hypothetical protein HU200_048570 [Digitaria exilis]
MSPNVSTRTSVVDGWELHKCFAFFVCIVYRVAGIEDVSSDDFSGPEAEARLKSLHNHSKQVVPNNMEQQVDEHENQPGATDNPPASSDASPASNLGCTEKRSCCRRPRRKQLLPNRAPFF